MVLLGDLGRDPAEVMSGRGVTTATGGQSHA
jgi:hypothetical protein